MSQDNQKKFAQLIAKAWADADFKARLQSSPAAVLREAGIEVPEGVDIKVVEDTDTVKHLVLPKQDDTTSLSGYGGSIVCG